MQKIIDLTHLLHNDISIYPGTEKPAINQIYSISEDGFAETRLNLLSHHGTHMDAPAHMILNGRTLDRFEIEQFYGKAICINCTNVENATIDLSVIEPFADAIGQADFVLLYSGWSEKWGTDAYFADFPVLSLDACKWLSQFDLKGIGLDNISLDKLNSANFENHRIILGKGMVIIENLTNLQQIGKELFTFVCLPLKYINADGAPVRAMAIV